MFNILSSSTWRHSCKEHLNYSPQFFWTLCAFFVFVFFKQQQQWTAQLHSLPCSSRWVSTAKRWNKQPWCVLLGNSWQEGCLCHCVNRQLGGRVLKKKKRTRSFNGCAVSTHFCLINAFALILHELSVLSSCRERERLLHLSLSLLSLCRQQPFKEKKKTHKYSEFLACVQFCRLEVPEFASLPLKFEVVE